MFGGHLHGRALLHEMEAKIKMRYHNAKHRSEEAHLQHQINSVRGPGLLERMARVILRRPHKSDNP